MKSIFLSFVTMLSLASFETWAALGDPIPGVEVISLSRGNFHYEVYDREVLHCDLKQKAEPGPKASLFSVDESTCHSELTTYIEIVETGFGPAASSAPVNLQGDLILEVVADGARNKTGLNQVAPKSALESLADNGASIKPGLNLRKSGSVIALDDKAVDNPRIINALKEIATGDQTGVGTSVFLSLPEIIQTSIDEAWVKNSRVIILIRVPADKKGPNAVNVKLA